MALQTKTITANGSRGNHKFTLVVNEESTNQDNNYSILSFTFSLDDVKPNYDWNYSSTVPVSYSITIGDNTYSGNIMKYDGTSNVVVKSGSNIRVNHNADGTKTISCSFSVSDIGKSFLPGACSKSATMTLTDIPRGAKIVSVSQFYDDENPVITYSNPAGNSVSSLEIAILDEDKKLVFPYRTITNKTGTSYTFEFSDEDREVLWNTVLLRTRQGNLIFRLKSVLGSNTFYSDFVGPVEIRNNAPVIAGLNIEDIQEDTYALTGDRYKAIKGYNTIQVFVDAEPQKGANIVEYRIKNGNTVSNDPTSLFINSENPTFEITVVDDRGAWTKQTYTMPMVDYFHPTCNLKTSTELIGETIARITITITGKSFKGSFGAKNNELGVYYRYKVGTGNYNNLTLISNPTIGANGDYTATTSIDVDYRESYTIQPVVKDWVNLDGVYGVEVPIRIIPVFDWSNEDFNFNVPISFNGQEMKDFIVEQGTSNGWTYKLWNSGLAECWRRLQITTPVNSAWGGLYSSGSLSSTNLSYPFSFTETPVLTVSLMPFGSGGLIMAPGSGYGSATQTGPFEIARGTALASGQFLLAYHASGKWK